jgi:fibronectin type 3 domain-containing protein
MKRVLVVAALLATGFADTAQADSMQAATTPPGPGLKVVLTWPATASVTRFNVYRRTTGAPVLLNGTPIARLTCPALKNIIPPNSPDWNALSSGLGLNGGPLDPCQFFGPGSTLSEAQKAQLEQRLQQLARASWRIALVAGQGYLDQAVTAGVTYTYELHGVDAIGNETGTVFAPVPVTAGSPMAIPPPAGLSAAAGDSRVLLLWGDQPQAAGFIVTRSTAAPGPYVQVNSATTMTKVSRDVDGNTLAPTNGFLDIQQWSPNGSPTTHLVNGVAIDGPSYGVTYYYKVASVDILGQAGPASVDVSATPLDKTPPSAPYGVSVTPIEALSQIEVRWPAVSVDRDGHIDSSGVAAYQVFRYDGENAPLASGTLVATGIACGQPPAPQCTAGQPGSGQTFVRAVDGWVSLRPPYGERDWWYRVRAVDNAGNFGAYSAAVPGHLKDITPPAPPKGVAAEGFDDYIDIKWDPNTEPDLDHYQVYRSYCHNGKCNPCDPRPENQDGKPASGDGRTEPGQKEVGKPEPCSGEYILIGTVSLAEAKASGPSVHFKDTTIPAGSPVCYSYWIKAYDHAQNMSGSWPFPAANEPTVCQRLRDKTPPDPAIISGLFSRDGAVRVEWVGPPVQDIRAYHVYRSEQQNGTYQWVGGMTVEVPPQPPKVLTAPYHPTKPVGCDTIPLTLIDSMSTGYAIDTKVEAKKFYWYKVVGIDQSGNEAPLAKAEPVATFTYTTKTPPAPTITSITPTTASPFALRVRWSPAFDPATTTGFAVFRSDQAGGLYRQIGTLQTAIEYDDQLVVRGATYWYKVVRVDLTGQVSQPSAAASGVLSP